jgi:phosphatidylcholine synthase
MNVGPRHLFAIHLLTASGAAFSLLSCMAAVVGDWTSAFIWLGIALVVDGIDGPIARRYRVRERLPKWDGAALDFVIDYTTYVFVPAIVVARGLQLSPVLGAFCGIVVAVSGALYFADTRMKRPDNSFRGFPAVWNMPVFVLYAFSPPAEAVPQWWPAVAVTSVVGLAILTFLPVNFVHPLRVVRWRTPTLIVVAIWFFSGFWVLAANFSEPLWVRLVLLAASTYLFCVAAAQQYLSSR